MHPGHSGGMAMTKSSATAELFSSVRLGRAAVARREWLAPSLSFFMCSLNENMARRMAGSFICGLCFFPHHTADSGRSVGVPMRVGVG